MLCYMEARNVSHILNADCRFIFFPRTHAAMVQAWLQERDMKAILVSPLDARFPREDVPRFPYEKTLEQAEWDPFVVLHTGGSTVAKRKALVTDQIQMVLTTGSITGDPTISLSSLMGEKPNPTTIEEIVEGHPEVRGALLVMLSNPDKALPRAGNRMIQRATAVTLYKEIDTLYEKQHRFSEKELPGINVQSGNAPIDSIRDVFRTRLGAEGLEPDNDFFSGGVDSLQVIGATQLLKSGLKATSFHRGAAAMATRVIYSNPTPRRLAQHILSVVRNEGEAAPGDEEKDEFQSIETLLRKYTSDLPQPANGRPDPADEGQTVILTGSTGMLGSYMLDLLVRNRSVKKVICFNRATMAGRGGKLRASS
ncbi:hypothetical protein DL769_009925 [Monosporascus sp. CRB-8-3]|nr:hypothetical protein DL769_009925 [Monosporascus sp. CRB-8-3]